MAILTFSCHKRSASETMNQVPQSFNVTSGPAAPITSCAATGFTKLDVSRGNIADAGNDWIAQNPDKGIIRFEYTGTNNWRELVIYWQKVNVVKARGFVLLSGLNVENMVNDWIQANPDKRPVTCGYSGTNAFGNVAIFWEQN